VFSDIVSRTVISPGWIFACYFELMGSPKIPVFAQYETRLLPRQNNFALETVAPRKFGGAKSQHAAQVARKYMLFSVQTIQIAPQNSEYFAQKLRIFYTI
jgi:hypothetical protein